MINKSCAFITEPPLCFSWGYDEEDERCAGLKLLLLQHLSYIQAQGIIRFYVSLDAGFGLYTSELIISLIGSGEKIQLYSLIPYEEQAVKWSPATIRKQA